MVANRNRFGTQSIRKVGSYDSQKQHWVKCFAGAVEFTIPNGSTSSSLQPAQTWKAGRNEGEGQCKESWEASRHNRPARLTPAREYLDLMDYAAPVLGGTATQAGVAELADALG